MSDEEVPTVHEDVSNKENENLADTSIVSDSGFGLRRSTRTPKPRVLIDKATETEERNAAEAAERRRISNAKAKQKAKLKQKALEKEKQMLIVKKEKEKERLKKQKLKQKEKEKAKKAKEKEKEKNKKKLLQLKAIKKNPTIAGGKIDKNVKVKEASLDYIPPVNTENWTPMLPLSTLDFKNAHSVISRFKNPNLMAVPYAGDVMKLMSFINKFYIFFDNELLNLSFQDFEIGLDLYPVTPQDIGMEFDNKKLLYQDYISVKEVIACQDKMNLVFLSLLRLLFDSSDSDRSREHNPVASLADLQTSKKVYAKYIEKLRETSLDWGYPQEWRKQINEGDDISKPKSKMFENDDTIPVDPKNPLILTENIYEWQKLAPIDEEDNPLFVPDIEKIGILALYPNDRIILFRALVDWCSANSPKVHNEIHFLSHFKKDPTFGIQTQHVPRYFLEGSKTTMLQFQRLCEIMEIRMEVRSKRKHVKKQIAEGKNEDFAKKMEILNHIKASYSSLTAEEKKKSIIENYDNWTKLFKGELHDNPLSDPYEDELYKLRSQEFFISRIPQVGDFYIPRLHSYSDSPVSVSTYTDLRSLENLLDKFNDGKYDTHYLFENFGQALSSQFKLLYHDTPTLISDMGKPRAKKGKVYWYEMCQDSNTLLEFIDFLDYKIASPVEKPKKKVKEEVENNTSENLQAIPEAKEPEPENVETDVKNEEPENLDPTINKKPLPKESRFNASRRKLKQLQDYLKRLYHILHAFEQLKKEYAGMKSGKRTLRRIQRRITYNDSDFDEDDERDNDEDNDEDEYPRANKKYRRE
ncbi:hypothetical protein TPHA_0O01110 [Tetrapisispora phaffii CBS 4417]|uniref:WHIM1 domain-containing protein n=1 Tax=Tetrapisispora phaffii (strain ATCC 24235 / CBS 4417 / NBRC 1672 / NRRL Y-8282 / UCD 70-5) TaxID=1071381 RepID=G8C1Q2_TETPH|nr:hypothetical protein TPHA_0O01110 [Tetrapisispora phaffii CBS 4417]CCE66080.1 hypothetical protein TPHA_0O01110 [Tetrapisispora phaffii CBS 4417]